ncbi:pseudouridine synthase [Treponema zioleckii]|uniref:pseudouridine synthase n=1 Tax=Treponema zioleckii TaxID=331680 RepID=UPI00168A50E1|nr:RluA family pseudouridine synthase [Treponema zioleckii]
MNFIHFTASLDDDGRRLDRILKKLLPEENLSSLYKSLRKGLIKVNGKKQDGNFKVSENDEILIADFLLNAEKPATEDCCCIKIKDEDILFRNQHLLILNKPYDIPVQPNANSKKGESISEMVLAEFKKSASSSLSFKPAPLHRLDRKTTGALVISQSLKGAQWFSDVIKNHLVKKIYVGIACGFLPEKQIWTDKIKREESSEKTAFHTVLVSKSGGVAGEEIFEDAKNAETTATPLAYGEYNNKKITLVKFEIGTGRTHQIRSQSQAHGFPLLGDTAYGGEKILKSVGHDFYLHAVKLVFPSDNPLEIPEKIEAPLPKKFCDFLGACLINAPERLIF